MYSSPVDSLLAVELRVVLIGCPTGTTVESTIFFFTEKWLSMACTITVSQNERSEKLKHSCLCAELHRTKDGGTIIMDGKNPNFAEQSWRCVYYVSAFTLLVATVYAILGTPK